MSMRARADWKDSHYGVMTGRCAGLRWRGLRRAANVALCQDGVIAKSALFAGPIVVALADGGFREAPRV